MNSTLKDRLTRLREYAKSSVQRRKELMKPAYINDAGILIGKPKK